MEFNYKWTLKDAVFTKDKGTVFSCFACGGGSTMGYKLAGFDVIGCNEIDPKMMECYIANHNPKYSYLEPIQTFKSRNDLPEELYNLDILDGSPPCSSFSMAGSREDGWGKEKKFREGQAKQVLDTLFFDFIDLAKKLQPKIVIAENVKGLLLGNAKSYVIEIYRQFDLAGYYVQHFLLDASKMGVPQRRERVFFIAMRKDLATPLLVQKDMFTIAPKLELMFNERQVNFSEILDNSAPKNTLNDYYQNLMNNLIFGEPDLRYPSLRLMGKENNFGNKIQYIDDVCYSILASDKDIVYGENRYKTDSEIIKAGSFPSDYNFLKQKSSYLIGMSVPPVMIARIATEIYNQWIIKINKQY
jgi:DNA (cytosine-5)-methyltransferase 1